MKGSKSTSEEKELFTGDASSAVWLQAFYAALNGGFDDPADCADHCLREFKMRFGGT